MNGVTGRTMQFYGSRIRLLRSGWPSQWPRTQLAFSSLKRRPGPHFSVKELQMAIDTRHRGKTGEVSRKHGNTLIRTLRKTYGSDFAKGCADDEKLSDILATLDEQTLSHLIRDHAAGSLEQICRR